MAGCSRPVLDEPVVAGQSGDGGYQNGFDSGTAPRPMASVEIFDRALAALEAVHAVPDPDAGLMAARAVLADLDVAEIRRVAAALALIAARAGRPDLAEWLERQRLELAWGTS